MTQLPLDYKKLRRICVGVILEKVRISFEIVNQESDDFLPSYINNKVLKDHSLPLLNCLINLSNIDFNHPYLTAPLVLACIGYNSHSEMMDDIDKCLKEYENIESLSDFKVLKRCLLDLSRMLNDKAIDIEDRRYRYT